MIKNKIYYLLLGIGLGIIITSSMNIVFNKAEKVEYTDEQIKEKAKSLGMISIKENIENKEKEKKEVIEESLRDIPKDEEVEEISEETHTVKGVKENTETTPQVKKKSVNLPQPKEGYKIVVIEAKDTATAIISKLKDAGIIRDVEEFKELLVQYNLQRKLKTGVYEIKIGLSDEEVLKSLVSEEELKNAGFL